MEIINKTCAVCGNKKCFVLKSGFLDKLNNEKAHAFSNLFEKNIEVCPSCNNTSSDISVATLEMKNYIKSENYQNIIEGERFDFLEYINNPQEICAYFLSGVVFEKNKDYLSAAKMLFLASEKIYYELTIYRLSQRIEDDLTQIDLEIIKSGERSADAMLDSAIKLVDKHLEINKDDVEAMLVKLAILRSKDSNLAPSYKSEIQSLSLSKEQELILEYLQ